MFVGAGLSCLQDRLSLTDQRAAQKVAQGKGQPLLFFAKT